MQGEKTKGEKYEAIAFQFCKVATAVLILRQWALPVASGLCAIFFLMAMVKGKHDTRCWLRYPWLIALFWGLVCAISTWLLLGRPGYDLLPRIL